MKTVVIILFCLVFLAPSVRAGWTGAVADQNISQFTDDSLMATSGRIVYNPCYDNLLAIWRQDITSNTAELAFSISTDFGVTWSGTSGDSFLSADDGQSDAYVRFRVLSIDIDSQGKVYVVWAETYIDSIEIMISISSDGGHTWTGTASDKPISCLVGENNRAYKPAIAVDNNDNIHVVWSEKPAGAVFSEIMYAKSVDGGISWSCVDNNKVISFPDFSTALNADIAIAPNNDIYVVWEEKNDPSDPYSKRIFYGKSTDGGQTFNSETADLPIGETIRSSGEAYIRIDLSGNVHVVWSATRAISPPLFSDVYYTGSTDGGATWSGVDNAILVDFGPGDSAGVFYPALAVTTDGKLACVWNEGPDQNNNVGPGVICASYSTDGGATWSGNNEPEVISFPGDHPSYRPHIFCGIGDTLHVVWDEVITSDGGSDIHYSKGDTLATGGGGGCDYTAGDVNGSSNYNGLDITYGVSYFKGGADPLCPDCPVGDCNTWHYCGDVNGSCGYNGLDITYGVAYFKGGPGPIPCEDCPPAE
ncbi:MAG: exo-alpha-sialidase [Candidatus Zixiibacteriota bacterium]|nr:MAG: exo-alpha-sialidase [candidate division Zixibacteria bacterium]